MQEEDFYMLLGELYVVQRVGQDKNDKLEAENNALKVQLSECQTRLDEKEGGDDSDTQP